MSGQAIYNKAKEYLGVPYVRGGTSPSGFDCSGFVYYVHRELGYNTPRESGALLNGGSAGSGAAGDVVCWNGHVGICDGNGNVIHAYGTNNGKVKINSIADVSRWDGRAVLGYRRYY